MMNQTRFAAVTHSLTRLPSRRQMLRGLAGAGLGWGVAQFPDGAATKRKDKPRDAEGLCRRDGSACRKLGRKCRKRDCLNAPFTVEARWTQTADHDTYLFVPPRDATTGASPYIHSACTPANSLCEEAYPFACFDNDETAAGDEVATISTLLPGAYEYFIGLTMSTPAGAVIVVLKDAGGRIVQQWASPTNPSQQIQAAWHVFDIDGRAGRVTAIDELLADLTPGTVHQPDTHVCPD